MASIGSLSGNLSSSSSIFGNKTFNMISGLASGLDTEQLITGAVQGYQQKIQGLQQDSTVLQWQQEAIQSISDKLVELNRNYCLFGYSDHNLMSSSFFSNAVTTTANGTYASLVTASGKSSSTILLNAVKSLATAARYTHSGTNLVPGYSADPSAGTVSVAGSAVTDLTQQIDISTLSGSLTLNYGTRTVSIDFGQRELYVDENGKFDAAAFQNAIVEKLGEEQISTSQGTMVGADTLIGVDVSEDGQVSFYDKSSAQNTVSIAGATGSLKDMISNLDSVVDAEAGTFALNIGPDGTNVTKKVDTAQYLSGKTITVTLDGKKKTITMPQVEVVQGPDGSSDPAKTAEKFAEALQEQLSDAFGAHRIQVSYSDSTNTFSFQTMSGSTLAVTAESEDVGNILGVGTGLSTYLDTTKTLGELNFSFDGLSGQEMKGEGKITEKKDPAGKTYYVDENGKTVDKDGFLLDKDGKRIMGYDLEINGVVIGTYSKDTEFNTIVNDINQNTQAGVNLAYSKTTGEFVFTAKDTGSGGRVEITGGLAEKLFGAVDPSTAPSSSYTAGQDAVIEATINGKDVTLSRSSNSFDLDGMNITLNGEFETKDNETPVSFTSKSDVDTIVDAVKSFVEDLNEILKEVKEAYSDMPLQKSDGSRYEPLLDEDMADMSESAIEAYEEKAKTGILFMDNDISSLYQSLINVVNTSGSDGDTLRSMGLEPSYSDGVTTITLDEKALREALEQDPDKVQQAFTKSKENGAATDGLMASIQGVLDRYASTTGDVKGILIEKAGSKYSPSAALDNTILNSMEDIEDEISVWQERMSSKVDYYTNRFTQLELLINQMNAQSSSLAGLMTG